MAANRQSSSASTQRDQKTAADIDTLAHVRPALRNAHQADCPDVDAMRSWKGKRKITRTVLLLILLKSILSFDDFTTWIERPNELLGGDAPLDLLNRRQWRMLGDFLDDILTGSPT